MLSLLPRLLLLSALAVPMFAQQGAAPTAMSQALHDGAPTYPWEWGAQVQVGNGVTDNRSGFHFLTLGVHAGKTLTPVLGSGLLRGSFEYAVEVLPLWQAYSPTFQRVRCSQTGTAPIACSAPYTVGGTFTGASVTPIILRWNLAGNRRLSPYAQAAGGLVWTNHKFPAYGNTDANLQANGPNGETSVFNFTPQGGVGVHYFVRPRRSIDFLAIGEHISSSSLGDRNPGVNASIQFSVGYTWWK
jgi:lipid A 3-O-deacylase